MAESMSTNIVQEELDQTTTPNDSLSPAERLTEVLPDGLEAAPVEITGFPGVSPNFSGAASDARLIELWLAGKSPRTRQAYTLDLSRFFDLNGSKPLSKTTLVDLQEFVTFSGEYFAPRTVARMLSTIKSLFSFANKTGYLPWNVGAAIDVPNVKDDLAERELSEADIHKVVHSAKIRRDRAMLRLMYAGGLRREDVCVLKWRDLKSRDDVRAGAGQVTVFGKGGKIGYILLPPSVFKELLSLRVPDNEHKEGQVPGLDEPIFKSRKKNNSKGGHLDVSTINRIVSAAVERAGMEEPVSPHWLRHSHATHAERRGARLSLIQKTLRHASPATTGRYLHANPSESSALHLGL